MNLKKVTAYVFALTLISAGSVAAGKNVSIIDNVAEVYAENSTIVVPGGGSNGDVMYTVVPSSDFGYTVNDDTITAAGKR